MMTMDPNRTNPEKAALEEDLRAIGSRWLSEAAEEPPGLLDQVVLNAARRELGGDAGSRRLRWLGGFATAAVVVVAATLVLQQLQYEGPAPAPPNGDGFQLDAESPAADATQRRDKSAQEVGREPFEPSLPTAELDAAPRAAAAPLRESYDTSGEAAAAESVEAAAAHWIERLLELKRSGQEDLLAEELAAFRRAHPGYPLPPELE
jgi:hypothetical protein